MKIWRGEPVSIPRRLVGRVSRRTQPLWSRRNAVLISTDEVQDRRPGYLGILTSSGVSNSTRTPCLASVPKETLDSLNDGDVVLLQPDGRLIRLWDVASNHNVVMVTNTCNCRCIMCPQPSCQDPHDMHSTNLRMLSLIGDSHATSIGFTGGEPTLQLDRLCDLLKIVKAKFPNVEVSLLTNGRQYADFEVARRIAAIEHGSLTHCVSLNADVDVLHDRIMGAVGSFRETVRGLHNLALLQQRVEIRVVLQNSNYRRLPQLAEFVYRNFPFVAHIALMGMETTGLALEHLEEVWVDPTQYVPSLMDAVRSLHQRDLSVSIYNLPLCLLPSGLWRFARDSISDWKKTFLPVCEGCAGRDRCSGLFATSEKHSPSIRAIR